MDTRLFTLLNFITITAYKNDFSPEKIFKKNILTMISNPELSGARIMIDFDVSTATSSDDRTKSSVGFT